MGRTLYDKILDEHVVHTEEDGTAVLYIDRHLVHEVTSPQAFEGLRVAGRKVWRVSSIVATADHNTPTTGWELGYDGIADPISKEQITTLDKNIAEVGAAAFFPFMDKRQGIVHVIGPEQRRHPARHDRGLRRQPHQHPRRLSARWRTALAPARSSTCMATQTLLAKKAKNMLVKVEGNAAPGITAKDIVLAIIGKIGTAGGTGYTIEFAGSAIRDLSIEGRMTVCNMAIEAGARAGLVAVDDEDHRLRQRPPAGAPPGVEWEQAVAYWQHAALRRRCAVSTPWSTLHARRHRAAGDLGHQPRDGAGRDARVPDPDKEKDANKRAAMERALTYMALEPGKPISDICVDKVFIGSLHQQPHRGHARGRSRGEEAGPKSGQQRQAGAGGARLGPGQSAGRARRPAPNLQSRRF